MLFELSDALCVSPQAVSELPDVYSHCLGSDAVCDLCSVLQCVVFVCMCIGQ